MFRKRQKRVLFSRKVVLSGFHREGKLLGKVAQDSRTHSPTEPEEGWLQNGKPREGRLNKVMGLEG